MTSPASWMTDSFATIGNRKLGSIAMPGSHDAGMSLLHQSTSFSTNCNTQTQAFSIAGQLLAGVRFFDLRPLAWSNLLGFYTGHFSSLPVLGLEGSAGQSIESILSQVSQFIDQPGGEKEIVILKFSHYLDYDRDATFDLAQMFDLVNQVAARLANQLYTSQDPAIQLATLTPAEIVAGSGRVIAVFDQCLPPIANAGRGIFSYADYDSGAANLVVFDRYSNTNSLSFMQADQLGKFMAFTGAPAAMFLASWTLTMQASDFVKPSICISTLAAQANPTLIEQMMTWLSAGYVGPGAVPNILYHDLAAPGDQVAQLCVTLNAATGSG